VSARYAQLPRAAAQLSSLVPGMPMAVAICASSDGGSPAMATDSRRKRAATDEHASAAAASAVRPPLGGPGMMLAPGTADAAARNWACGHGISSGMAPSSEAACNWLSGQLSPASVMMPPAGTADAAARNWAAGRRISPGMTLAPEAACNWAAGQRCLGMMPKIEPSDTACNWASGTRGPTGSAVMMHAEPTAPGMMTTMAPSSEAACNWVSVTPAAMMHAEPTAPAAPTAAPADSNWDLGLVLGTSLGGPEFSVDDLGLDEPSPSSGRGHGSIGWPETHVEGANGARSGQVVLANGTGGGVLAEGPSAFKVCRSDP